MAKRTNSNTNLGFNEPIERSPVRPNGGRKTATPSGDTGTASGNQEPTNESEPVIPIVGESEPERSADNLGGIPVIDPFTVDGYTDNGSTTGDGGTTTSGATGNTDTRKRGRPFGSRNKTQAATPNLASLQAMLFSIHMAGARILSTPEMELDVEESKRYAEALAEVAKHYSFGMDEKKLAITNLIFTMGSIYGGRFIAIHNRKKAGPKLVTMPTPEKEPDAHTVSPNTVPTTAPERLTPSQIWNEAPIDNPIA